MRGEICGRTPEEPPRLSGLEAGQPCRLQISGLAVGDFDQFLAVPATGFTGNPKRR